MARESAVKNYFTFVKGLVTEATGLTFPENASFAEDNFELFKNGSRRRRKGCDYETSYVLSSNILASYFSDRAVSAHRWTAVAGSGLTNFVVVQVGPILYFHDLNVDSFSANLKAFTVDLSTYAAPGITLTGTEPIQTDVGNGLLFVVSSEINPIYIEYDIDTDNISVTQTTINIRDFTRQDDGLAFDNRPSSLSNEHKYNLKNQGWSQTNIDAFKSSQGVYPSNSDIWYLGKDSNDDFKPALLVKQDFGNTLAPNGHFIVDSTSKVREDLTTESTSKRPSAVAFTAGRVFYGGIGSSKLANRIFYTQILETNEQIGRCYQVADPTSEHISELVPTDGGEIVIPEMGKLVTMSAMLNSLIVFADNGVWLVTGSSGLGFLADDYVVKRLSTVGIIGADTVVNVEGSIIYWASGGIYALAAEEVSGDIRANNISSGSIQTFYNGISEASKTYAKGVYDEEQKVVSWTYNKDINFQGGSFKNKYDGILVLNVELGSFSPLTIKSIPTDTPYIASPVISLKLRQQTITSNVIVNGDPVTVSTDPVTISLVSVTGGSSKLKFVTAVPQADGVNYKYTFAEFSNTNFLDWETADSTGVDSAAYLETGFEILDDATRSQQVPYLFTMFQKTETGFIDVGGDIVLENPSGCLISPRWDWADHTNSGKWGTQFQAYRFRRLYTPTGAGDPFDDGTYIVQTKNRLRGVGKALQLRIDTEPAKDCHILGWTIFADVAGAP